MSQDGKDKFESWAIVEVMGHKRLAGMVTEQTIGGTAFLRVDVPECGDVAAFTQFLGSGSIYCLTPCTEEVAHRAVASFRARPVQYLDLSPARALPAPAVEDRKAPDDDGYSGNDTDYDGDKYGEGDE